MVSLYLKFACTLLISIILLNAQLRIVATIFPSKQEKKKILAYTLFMWAIIAWLILFFTYYIQPLLSDIQNSSLRYSAFILISGALLSLLCAAKRQRRGLFIVSTTTLLAIITWWIEWLLAGWSLGILLLKAAWEEVLKTASSQSLVSHSGLYKSDVIVMSILAGLGFALFENIVYFLASGSRGEFLTRSITTSLLHAIFTGCIWYVLWRQSKPSFTGYILAYIAWIGLHSIYNILLGYSPVVGWIIFLIGWYFLLSYLLYKSDRIYVK